MPRSKDGIKGDVERGYAVDRFITIGGRRVHVYKAGFRTEGEARAAMPAIMAQAYSDRSPSGPAMAFSSFVGGYLDYKSAKSKPQTLELCEGMIRKHIEPRLTGRLVSEALSPRSVGAWYAALASDPSLSAERKNRVISLMLDMIGRAWAWHLINSEQRQDLADMVQPVKAPRQAKPHRGIWTASQERDFLSAVPDGTMDKAMLTLFCYLGCRLGELLGLQWGCLDEEKRSVSIRQQVVGRLGGWVLTDELKTDASYREDLLDGETFAILENYKASCGNPSDGDFMFPSSPSDPRSPLSRTEFRRRFGKYIEASGVPKIVPHGVRHSKATMLASVCRNAEDVAVAAAFLGHSPSMFMGTYVSAHGTSQSDLLARLGGGQD